MFKALRVGQAEQKFNDLFICSLEMSLLLTWNEEPDFVVLFLFFDSEDRVR